MLALAPILFLSTCLLQLTHQKRDFGILGILKMETVSVNILIANTNIIYMQFLPYSLSSVLKLVQVMNQVEGDRKFWNADGNWGRKNACWIHAVKLLCTYCKDTSDHNAVCMCQACQDDRRTG